MAVKQYGTLLGDGFRVEKLTFESLPGFWVSANLYVPAGGSGPFPAMVLIPGHEAAGKYSQYGFGVNFARMGIVSLAFDPIGQGERLQYFDAARKASAVGAPTGEHGEANLAALLIGDNLVKYMVNDGMRAIDYLTSRKEVDGGRIGALGCSGGGAATAVLAALDDRVKAAGSACYITSFEQLLVSAAGVQEAEQSLPHFVEQGLDLADWVELAAPRPYAIISATEDMFPFEGARQTYQEAKRIYGLYGAAEKLQWITGPGGHGNLGPISPAILGFFAKYLKGDGAPQRMTAERAVTSELQVMPGGQVGGETVASINRKRVAAMAAPRSKDLRAHILALTGAGTKGIVGSGSTEQRQGYRVESFTLRSVAGVAVRFVVAIPDGGGRVPATLRLEQKTAEISGETERAVRAGEIVAVLEAEPWPAGTESIKSPFLGAFNLFSLRAFLVGKTILGMRLDDALTVVQWMAGRPDVGKLTVHGIGALGLVALHAGVLDRRIERVVMENSLVSYRSIVDVAAHRDASEVVIPGVLKRYDVGDLLKAMGTRGVEVVNPVDGAGAPVREAEYRRMTGAGQSVRVRVAR